jgi:hypothetical protein
VQGPEFNPQNSQKIRNLKHVIATTIKNSQYGVFHISHVFPPIRSKSSTMLLPRLCSVTLQVVIIIPMTLLPSALAYAVILGT